MARKRVLKNKLVVYVLSALLVVMASFGVYNVLSSYFSLSNVVEKQWDGVSVSSSFSSGNGSEDNPYVIKSGADLAYFKSLIEGLNYSTYNDKYYILGADIDLGDNEFASIGIVDGEVEKFFKGHFDGNGYTIKNTKITGNTINNYEMYGLFTIIDGGYVTNVNLENIDIYAEKSTNPYMIGVVASEVRTLSNIKNISIYGGIVDLSSTLSNSSSKIALVVGNVSNEVEISNIYLEASLSSNYSNDIAKVSHTINSSLNNIIINVKVDSLIAEGIGYYVFSSNESTINNLYLASVENNSLKITSNGDSVSVDTLMTTFDKDITGDFFWGVEDGVFKLFRVITDEKIIVPSYFAFGNAVLAEHATGVDYQTKTAYLNDLDADKNGYLGMNYTWQGLSSTIPDGTNKNTYNSSNLVKTFIQYNGTDPSTKDVGYVSLSEQITNFNYYKYYVLENGYITIELIDHPYGDRPDDKAFGGWVTDYPGAIVWYDSDIHVYYAKVPVTDVSATVNIIFYARWVPATTATISSSTSASSFNTAMGTLAERGFKEFEGSFTMDEDITNLWFKVTVGQNGAIPKQYYDENLVFHSNSTSTRCSGTCTYYRKNNTEAYDSSRVYYEEVAVDATTNTLVVKELNVVATYEGIVNGSSAAGYYVQKTFSRGESTAGYYNSTGAMFGSGSTCGSTTCTYYELLQFKDANGNENVVDLVNNTYYWMINRDTNILFVNSNSSISANIWSQSNYNIPFTITGMNNGVYSTARLYMGGSNSSIGLQEDLRVEYIDIYVQNTAGDRSPTGSTNTRASGNIKGNYYNLKLGRGIEKYSSYLTALSVVGGSNSRTGSNATPTRYRLIIESGYYNNIGAVAGAVYSGGTAYVDMDAIYGSDFDRAVGDANIELLEIAQTAAGTWGTNVSSSGIAVRTTIKSGSFGTYSNADYSYGVYAGGLSYGSRTGVFVVNVEGGYIYNLNGGPCVSTSKTTLNDLYINIKGGSVDYVFGGAGRSETHGNRILNITGGTVNRAAYGGSNGYLGSNGEGVLSGSTFVYVGGNATIGSEDALASGTNPYGEIVGSVYGIGNGRSGTRYTDIGTALASTVIIDGDAVINGNVFGGGNYGAVGTQGDSSTKTKVKILGGTVVGSVYGGGNNNGAGISSSIECDISIDMTGGTVGNIYGGSRSKGIVYGDTNLNILGGTVVSDIYGGGEGGYTDASTPGTFVTGNSIVNIGQDLSTGSTELALSINGNVYGGSAYGTVNGSSNTGSAVDNLKTTVDVYYGVVKGSVFGGGKGSTAYTPKVYGPVTVTIHNGNIGKVFGGNDAAGQPAGADKVILKGGIIGNAFGGGNSTGQNTTDISLEGATVTNLFGGSNTKGVVNSTNVVMTSGIVDNVYGGNNEGTSTDTTVVNISGGVVNKEIYGGGMQAPVTTSTSVTVTAPQVGDVYGGGQQADANETSVVITGTNCGKVFGGSNTLGLVNKSSVEINGHKLTAVYGGNNAGGTTTSSIVKINSGTIGTVFGGGDQATTGSSDVTINGGVITNVFGGGNLAGLTTSKVKVLGGTITNVYGGSNEKGDVSTTNVEVSSGPVEYYISEISTSDNFWMENNYTVKQFSVSLKNNTNEALNDWSFVLKSDLPVVGVVSWNYEMKTEGYSVIATGNDLNGNVVTIPAGGTISISFQVRYDYLFDWSNKPAASIFDLTDATNGLSALTVQNVYGGNNLGGTTGPTSVLVSAGTINDIYGGGFKAQSGSTNVVVKNANVTNIFGGGNAANVVGNTFLDIDDSTLNTDVYGGGNEGTVSGNSDVYVTNSIIHGSLYAGGNGSTATVYGNTNVTVDGDTIVGSENSAAPKEGCVFGGGKAALTGTPDVGTSKATVNIVGGHIYGNVYGGANFAVVYGGTITNVGKAVVSGDELLQSDIIIDGTVFGGGETYEEGNEDYSFDFNSVVGSIDVYIDGTGYVDAGDAFTISGSIFGSGNASSSSGTSNITIKKLGTKQNPSRNISIQRTNKLIIDNSYIELKGIEDRTNDFSTIKYSFNQIDDMIIKNNTTLYLRKNANLLKKFTSGVDDSNGNLVAAKVTINDDTKTVTKNVDNRIYMLPYNNLNITTTQDATSYGKVTGMTFYGMYNVSSDGTISCGLYDSGYSYGSATGAKDLIIGSSYVLGLHHDNHDITVDGFYTNVFNDEMTSIITEYIEPTPPSSNFYRWIIGMQTVNYIVDLTASKYSSLGTYNLTMLDFPDGDTTFEVIGFSSSGLNSGINLVDPSEVPRLADTEDIANTTFGLAMKSETREWTGYNVTEFTDENGGTALGDTLYKTDSQKVAPSMMFYLYHPKNITKEGDVGSVLITMQSEEPINEIESKFQYVTITVNIVARNYNDGNSYDASITYDKKYEMPSATSVNITNQSQFTAYYSLYALGTLKEIYGENYENYHVLTSTYALPAGTQITMIDYGYDINNPQYYYFDITDDVYTESVNQLNDTGEITYRLSDFIKMGSTSSDNNYSDLTANKKYFDGTSTAMEEFVFIFDLKETTTTGEHLENSILFELRDSDDIEIITVLGIRRALMQFNLYDSSNVVLQENMSSASEYLYYNIVNKLDFQSIVGYDQTTNGAAIIDTNYESSAMGLNMYVYDNDMNQVSSSLLSGTVLKVDGVSNFSDSDGVFRIKLAGKVSNLSKTMDLLVDKVLPPGNYTLRFVLFASDDGKHNSSLEKSAIVDIPVTVVGDENAIVVTTDDKIKVVDGDTGLNQLGTKTNEYVLTYLSVLHQPNVRVNLYKRDTIDKDTTNYTEVDFNTLFTNQLSASAESTYLYEKSLEAKINDDNVYNFELQDNLISGTYKLVFRLYDGSQLIEEENEYIIVTKDIANGS